METNKSFIIRLIAFLMAALVLPCIYLAIRFNLFKSKMAISIWGIIIIGLILIVVSAMIKFYLAGMKTKWSYLKQILEGFIKVIFSELKFSLVYIHISEHIKSVTLRIFKLYKCPFRTPHNVYTAIRILL